MRLLSALAVFSVAVPFGNAQTAPVSKPPKIDFERLVTNNDETYDNVSVLEVQPDSLIIQHRNGVARVSLFDLSDEIRRNYGFDHDKAMAHYKKRDAEQRVLRKKLFYDRIKFEAEQEKIARQQNFVVEDNPDWIHVRAKILSIDGNHAMAKLERIVMRAAPRRKTALGGEALPDPPIATYTPLSPRPVLLSEVKNTGKAIIVGQFWIGYVHRSAQNEIKDGVKPKFPVYKTAVPRR